MVQHTFTVSISMCFGHLTTLVALKWFDIVGSFRLL